MTATATSPVLANDFYAPLKARAAEIEAQYRNLTPVSAGLFEQSKGLFPGGFTRDAVIRKPYSPFIAKGEGPILTDSDGRAIVDFWFNASSLPLGHADPRVVAAVNRQLGLGTAYFAPTETELALARILCERLPSAEQARFANSGSEAVMIALRLARGFTGRDLVVKCEGSYHGAYDDVQWSVAPAKDKFGAPDSPVPVPDSAGLPESSDRILVLPYNNPEILRREVRARADRVAALIIEPLANRMGLIPPTPEFLAAARELSDEIGAVLIFDEVIAFRLGYHGAQGFVGMTPDVTTLGKVIGGGFPVGAVVGKTDVMAASDASRRERVTHAGTFNANPVTMSAGRATMEALTPDVYDSINAKGAKMRAGLEAATAGVPLTITGAGSFFKINATAEDITDYRTAVTVDGAWEEVLSLGLFNAGFMLTPHLHGCCSAVTTDEQIDGFLAAFTDLITP
ncbi:MAG: aspartate aminotransferase family protein [Rhodospirillales bacterium]|jgi:glutamate-1-semialdehyde 2,1-aminomutase|nr:aspartate aminotransferase family protein [Rhodospirillales bacterium]MDP6883491.1 aspartate aminotransferase family protein [Rhodospirillales bacterium]